MLVLAHGQRARLVSPEDEILVVVEQGADIVLADGLGECTRSDPLTEPTEIRLGIENGGMAPDQLLSVFALLDAKLTM